MKKIIFAFSLVASFIITNGQTTILDSIYSGNMYRTYRLYIPAVYNGSSARPLIINMHGYTSNSNDQQYYSNFMPIADTANFLVVHPQGTIYSGQTYWNAGISPLGADDIGFISRLIDSLKAQYNIDLNSVYSTGMSNGGFMSHTLACELSNRIAAIASVTGSIFNTQYGSNCHPTRPMPVMQIHGTADATVPYAGNSTMAPVDSVVKYWVTKNGCNTTAVFNTVPNTSTSDGCTAEHYVYNNGTMGSTVELYKIIGGGHTWPGAIFNIGVTNQDMNASVEIWRFFRKYKLSMFVGLADVSAKNISIATYPNPVSDKLFLNGFVNESVTVATVTDILGNVVIPAKLMDANEIEVDHLSGGIYFLTIQNTNHEIVTVKFVKQ